MIETLLIIEDEKLLRFRVITPLPAIRLGGGVGQHFS